MKFLEERWEELEALSGKNTAEVILYLCNDLNIPPLWVSVNPFIYYSHVVISAPNNEVIAIEIDREDGKDRVCRWYRK